tara:strand:+ start:229 stop:465 length:237 start_codon:yes stop_codon:yes gene_type:complete
MSTFEKPVVKLLTENHTKMWSTNTIRNKLNIKRKRDAVLLIEEAIVKTKELENKVRQVNPLEVGSWKTHVSVFTVKKK